MTTGEGLLFFPTLFLSFFLDNSTRCMALAVDQWSCFVFDALALSSADALATICFALTGLFFILTFLRNVVGESIYHTSVQFVAFLS